MRVLRQTAFRALQTALIFLSAVAAGPQAHGAYLWSNLAGSMGGAGIFDGTGSVARFNRPYGIVSDTAGNLYVADTDNHIIRKVTPAGVVTTLAGVPGQFGSADGTGANARFSAPAGIALGSDGTLYVTDRGNNTVRKISSSAEVTTLAGTPGYHGSADGTGGEAEFDFTTSYAVAVAVDAAGNVFVADVANSTIRKITPDGVVTTFAGQARSAGSQDGTGSNAKFNRIGGLAFDSSSNLYATDSDCTIRKITPGATVTTLAGLAGEYGTANGMGSIARFQSPFGITVDASGNLFVMDTFNLLVRKVTPAGLVSTLAGSPFNNTSIDGTAADAHFNFAFGIAIDGSGNLYIADTESCTIRKLSGGVASTVAGLAVGSGYRDDSGAAAQFTSPRGVAFDKNGVLYVCDTDNFTIRKITPGGTVSTLAGHPGIGASNDGTGLNASFNYPAGLALDDLGNVYVADQVNYTIRKITPTGVVTTLAGKAGEQGSKDGPGLSARFYYPYALVVDAARNVYVNDSNGTLRKITPQGVVSTLAGKAATFGYKDGTGSAARFSYLTALQVDGAGNIYAADAGVSAIRKITPAGVVTTVIGPPPGYDPDSVEDPPPSPWGSLIGLALDGQGNFIVTNGDEHTIRRVAPNGEATLIGGVEGAFGNRYGYGAASRFNYPYAVAVAADGRIIVAGGSNANVVVGTPQTYDATTLPASALSLSGATMNGTVNADGHDTDVTFEYGPTENYGTTVPATPATVTGSATTAVSATLAGLISGTAYHFRVVSHNDTAGTIQGYDQMFTAFDHDHLASLTISSGVLVPAFVSTTTEYSLKLPNGVNSLALTPILADGAAMLSINDVDAPSGSPVPLMLRVGANVFLFKVTAPHASAPRIYTLTVMRAAGPIMSIQQPAGTELVDGTGTIDFGGAVPGKTVSRVLSIKNTGTAPLSILGTSIDGSNAADFTVTTHPAATIAAGAGMTFTVVFKPGAVGLSGATLHVMGSDVDHTPFDIALAGTGTARPAVTSLSAALLKAVGEPATFTGTATGGALAYQWLKNGLPVTGATAASLTLPAVTLANGGSYKLKVTNASATVISDNAIELGVVDTAPRMLPQAAKATASITVNTAGNGLHYAWMKGGGALPADARFTGGTTKTLAIKLLKTDDDGIYTCDVTGPGGMVAGAPVTLAVYDTAPVITPLPGAMSDAHVSTAYPPFQIPVDMATHLTPSSYSATGLPAGLACNAASGIITGRPTVSKTTSYAVTLKATNARGSSSASTTLFVHPLPDTLRGTFNALLDRDTTLGAPMASPPGRKLLGHGGSLENLVVMSSGVFTGSLKLEDKTYPIPPATVLDAHGAGDASAQVTIKRGTGIADLVLNLHFNATTGELTGTLTDNQTVTPVKLQGWHNSWHTAATTTSPANPAAALAGTYTTMLEPVDLAHTADPYFLYPEGYGWATVTISTAGSVTWSGVLADGTAVTRTTTLGPNGEIPLHWMLYTPTIATTAGSAHGWVIVGQGTDPSKPDDNLLDSVTGLGGQPVFDWEKQPQAATSTTRSYKGGIPLHKLKITGGGYVRAASVALGLGGMANNAKITVFGAGVESATTFNNFAHGGSTQSLFGMVFTLTTANKAVFPSLPTPAAANPAGLVLTLNVAAGTFTGNFSLYGDFDYTNDPAAPPRYLDRKANAFAGVLINRIGKGAGCFQVPLLPDTGPPVTTLATSPKDSGYVLFEAAP